jgi:hypothetical protein
MREKNLREKKKTASVTKARSHHVVLLLFSCWLVAD